MDGLDGASSIPPIITPGTSATPQGVESSDTSSSGSTISTIRLGNLQVVSLTAILSGMTLLINFETGVFGMNARTLTEENLGLSSREAYWAIHCYYITAACSIIIFGKASDILGPKPVWLAGCTAYFIATTLYAAEHNLAQLVMVRTLLGLAVAINQWAGGPFRLWHGVACRRHVCGRDGVATPVLVEFWSERWPGNLLILGTAWENVQRGYNLAPSINRHRLGRPHAHHYTHRSHVFRARHDTRIPGGRAMALAYSSFDCTIGCIHCRACLVDTPSGRLRPPTHHPQQHMGQPTVHAYLHCRLPAMGNQ
ncbi:hypothetical protein M8818_007354 [Zalaria obscura]|uniref:Uncharacterized protein n=1 Tax=Zalaria obscura TaxID=2024903 RepID=A0ACC3S4T4_9PEZI